VYSLDILEIVLHLYLQPEIRQLGGATGIDGMYSFFVSGACVGHAKNWQSIQMAHVTICQHLPNVSAMCSAGFTRTKLSKYKKA